jgi:hypothetical protein
MRTCIDIDTSRQPGEDAVKVEGPGWTCYITTGCRNIRQMRLDQAQADACIDPELARFLILK